MTIQYAPCMTTQIAVRLPEELVVRIDSQLSNTSAGSRSELVRRALEEYLYRLACESDAARYDAVPMDATELALADAPDGWEPTPAW